MKKIDKLSLLFKDRGLKLITYYLTMVLSIQLLGSYQDFFNHKVVKQYKEIVEDFGEYLKENDIEDPTQVFDYFNYALWGGYLSKDHNFKFNYKRDIFYSTYGLGCVLGDCVCLNNAGMLSDLYKSMGMDSEVVMCYVPVDKIRIYNIRGQENITRKVADTEEDAEEVADVPFVIRVLSHVKPLSFVYGNHAITLVEYDGEYYYYDATNLAYLSKGNTHDLNIINGEGSFKSRNITTFLFEVDAAFKGLFENNQDDYNLEYLENLETTDIDVLKLEEFYQQEKELIDSVYDSLKSKSQKFIKALSMLLTLVLVTNVHTTFEKVIYRKNIKNELKLKYLISLFMREHGIENFEEVCCYLHELITQGDITCDDDNLRIKKSVLFETSALVTVDNQEYGKKFFESYLKSKFKDVEIIRGIELEWGIIKKDFFVYRGKDGYKFYSYGSNLVYNINDYYELVSTNGEYKILKVFKKKYKNSVPVEQPSINYEYLDEFALQEKDKIDEIAKAYTYVPKK